MSVSRSWTSGAGTLSANRSSARSTSAALISRRPSRPPSWAIRSTWRRVCSPAMASASCRSSMPPGRYLIVDHRHVAPAKAAHGGDRPVKIVTLGDRSNRPGHDRRGGLRPGAGKRHAPGHVLLGHDAGQAPFAIDDQGRTGLSRGHAADYLGDLGLGAEHHRCRPQIVGDPLREDPDLRLHGTNSTLPAAHLTYFRSGRWRARYRPRAGTTACP